MAQPADRLDVLIVTAADGEDDAVRQVTDGARVPWYATDGPEDYGFTVWRAEFDSDFHSRTDANGPPTRTLRVGLTRAAYMGVESSGHAAAALALHYKPQCIAMTGVCAGRPEWTTLGDVIVVDRVYRYDVGEVVNAHPGAVPVFHGDLLTIPFRPQWKQRAETLEIASDTAWLAQRPRPRVAGTVAVA